MLGTISPTMQVAGGRSMTTASLASNTHLFGVRYNRSDVDTTIPTPRRCDTPCINKCPIMPQYNERSAVVGAEFRKYRQSKDRLETNVLNIHFITIWKCDGWHTVMLHTTDMVTPFNRDCKSCVTNFVTFRSGGLKTINICPAPY